MTGYSGANALADFPHVTPHSRENCVCEPFKGNERASCVNCYCLVCECAARDRSNLRVIVQTRACVRPRAASVSGLFALSCMILQRACEGVRALDQPLLRDLRFEGVAAKARAVALGNADLWRAARRRAARARTRVDSRELAGCGGASLPSRGRRADRFAALGDASALSEAVVIVLPRRRTQRWWQR